MTPPWDERALNYSDSLTRFTGILCQLPVLPVPRVLDLGCGTARCAVAIQRRWPEVRFYGLDWVTTNVQKNIPSAAVIQGDLRALPLRRQQFGLVVIRHPDVDCAPQGWQSALHIIPELLSEDGLLLVTCYSLAELDRIRGWLANRCEIHISSVGISPPDSVKHDRYAAAWRFSGKDRRWFARC